MLVLLFRILIVSTTRVTASPSVVWNNNYDWQEYFGEVSSVSCMNQGRSIEWKAMEFAATLYQVEQDSVYAFSFELVSQSGTTVGDSIEADSP